ncbi:MAG TPA: type II secretion system F family protein [Gammaproteobacteria bacterium]|nr:type II secretion system F family protein [Gammaproteobacteria bacterium]
MPIFNYKGRVADKQAVEGKIESISMDTAIIQLVEKGITVVDIYPAEQKNLLKAFLTMRINKQSVKLQELIIFCRQMYTLTKAGISIVIAIRRLAEITRNPLFADTLNGVEKGLLAGQSLGVCLRHYPQVFPSLFMELIQVGEESGHLDDSFQQVGNYLQLEFDTIRRVKSTIRYPLMVICAITAAIIIVNIFVVPNFAKLYGSFQTQLPAVTRLLISFSNMMVADWLYFLIAIIVGVMLIRSYLNTLGGKLAWDKYQLRLPIIGGILERIMLSRFARTLAIVFRAGISLDRGIRLLAGSVGNAYAKEKILIMQTKIENGEKLSQAAAETKMFSPLVLQMISVGEETGAMDVMLDQVAGFYEDEVDYDLDSLGAKIEPILLLIVAGMVLFLALAVFLPLWDIYQFAQPAKGP